MSLHTLLAHEVRSKGRGDDTMLIHMTPQEVGGLQALAMAHGGSLSINPDTGLPEAGFLKNILPTLVGAGLTFFSGGALSPMAAGLITGGIQTARTGDLGQGILAGLGAFGGGSLGAAANAAGSAATTAGTSMTDLAAQQAIDAGVPIATAPTAGLPSAATPSQMTGLSGSAGDFTSSLTPPAPTGLANLSTPTSFADKFSNFSTELGKQLPTTGDKVAATIGLTAPFMPPEPELEFAKPEDPYANYEGPYTPSDREVRYPSVLDSREFTYFNPSNPIPYAEGGETEDRSIKRPGADYNVNQGEFDYNFRPVEIDTSRRADSSTVPAAVGGKGRIGGKGAQNDIVGYSADGSPVYARNPNAPEPGLAGAMRRALGIASGDSFGNSGAPAGMSEKDRKKYGYDNAIDTSKMTYDPYTQQLVRRYAQGGLTAFAKGRFLEGPGDGTSDDIPAVIGNRQPARLADGEFVIDARTVSEIGNGSSKAGAKKLYAMMDRVHNERKKAKRGKDSNADKHLPA